MGKLPIEGEPLLYRIFLNKGVPSRGPIEHFDLIPGPNMYNKRFLVMGKNVTKK